MPAIITAGRCSIMATRNGPCGKAAGAPRKSIADEVPAIDIAVRQHADEMPLAQPLGHRDQRIQPPQADHLGDEFGVDGGQGGADFLRVLLIHQQADRQILAAAAADGARHFETAEMRAEQNAAAALALDVAQNLLAMHGDLERIALLVEQEDAVQQAAGEGEEMGEAVGQARGAAQERGADRRWRRATAEGEEARKYKQSG